MEFHQIKTSKTKTEIFMQIMLIISRVMKDISNNNFGQDPNNITEHQEIFSKFIKNNNLLLNPSEMSRKKTDLLKVAHLPGKDIKRLVTLQDLPKIIQTAKGDKDQIFRIITKYKSKLQNIDIGPISIIIYCFIRNLNLFSLD